MDSSWESILAPHRLLIQALLDRADSEESLPSRESIFRALELPRGQVRAIILGQDPYPTPGMAEGLAFSVPPSVSKLPASLRNILIEYGDDLSLPTPQSGHLGNWVSSGVLLLNRILTVRPGAPLSHQGLGWERVTDEILLALAKEAKPIPIICWGNYAQTAASRAGFSEEAIFASPHPSPLSAYRGFFGSKPFSSVNKYLVQAGLASINWKL